MRYRHEDKYIINTPMMNEIVCRLKTILKQDKHQVGDCYKITSLYYDDMNDSCWKSNMDGLSERAKYRIRHYNDNLMFARLEKKGKHFGLTYKEGTVIDRIAELQYDSIGNISSSKLASELIVKNMVPVCYVKYKRKAYVHPIQNTRITFDMDIIGRPYDISGCQSAMSILPLGSIVMEIKYDRYFPEFIRKIIYINGLYRTRCSKYAITRSVLAKYS